MGIWGVGVHHSHAQIQPASVEATSGLFPGLDRLCFDKVLPPDNLQSWSSLRSLKLVDQLSPCALRVRLTPAVAFEMAWSAQR